MQLETRITDEISLIYSTPVMAVDVADAGPMNEALMSEISGARAIGTGVRGSNVGGWQSAHDLWQWPGDGAQALRASLQRAVNTISAIGAGQPQPTGIDIFYNAQAWANINGPGHYNVRHSNAQFDWQIFYFVAGADISRQRAPAGRLEIHDPRRLADISPLRAYGFAGSMLIDPVPGKLVLIPAWMEHSIHPFYTAGELVWVSGVAKMTGGRHSGLRSAGY